MARFTPAQLSHAASVLRSWAATTPISSSERAEKMHEVFVAIGVAAEIFDRAKKPGRATPNVEILDRDLAPQTKFVPRTNPGVLGSGQPKGYAALPTFIRINYVDGGGNPRVAEVHQSVRWVDGIGVAHEADIAVLSNSRSPADYKSTKPLRASLALTVECKLWKGRASLGSAREAEAFQFWVGSSVHAMAHSGPFAPTTANFIAGVARELHYFSDVGDPASPSTTAFFSQVVTRSAPWLAL